MANLLCQHGYFFPVGECNKNLSVKDDSSLYRFQVNPASTFIISQSQKNYFTHNQVVARACVGFFLMPSVLQRDEWTAENNSSRPFFCSSSTCTEIISPSKRETSLPKNAAKRKFKLNKNKRMKILLSLSRVCDGDAMSRAIQLNNDDGQ